MECDDGHNYPPQSCGHLPVRLTGLAGKMTEYFLSNYLRLPMNRLCLEAEVRGQNKKALPKRDFG